ncbi:MAG: hypothetical protein WD403_07625 [Pirellulales bacterium]
MRRPFQFRLRALFWLTALAGVLCAVGPALAQPLDEFWSVAVAVVVASVASSVALVVSAMLAAWATKAITH